MGTDRQLVTVDAAGNVTAFANERRAFEIPPSVSRDGRKVAAVLANQKGTYETWIADLDRPGLKRALALPNADCAAPVWSPDGQRLAYYRQAYDKDDGVYVQRADGAGSPQEIVKTADSRQIFFGPTSWAPGSAGLLVNKQVAGKSDILFVPISATGEPGSPRALRATPADERNARFSPDGRFVAFASDESGRGESLRRELERRRHARPAAAGLERRRRATRVGGRQPPAVLLQRSRQSDVRDDGRGAQRCRPQRRSSRTISRSCGSIRPSGTSCRTAAFSPFRRARARTTSRPSPSSSTGSTSCARGWRTGRSRSRILRLFAPGSKV